MRHDRPRPTPDIPPEKRTPPPAPEQGRIDPGPARIDAPQPGGQPIPDPWATDPLMERPAYRQKARLSLLARHELAEELRTLAAVDLDNPLPLVESGWVCVRRDALRAIADRIEAL